MKIAFLSFPDYSHIYPCIELLNLLYQMGAEMTFYSTENNRKWVQGKQIRFFVYPDKSIPDKDKINNQTSREDIITILYALFNRLITYNKHFYDIVYTDLHEWDPDLIIHDSFSFWGKLIAKQLQKPAISSNCLFIYENKFIQAGTETFISKYFPGFNKRNRFEYSRFKKILEIQFKKNCTIPIHNPLTLFTAYENLNIVYTSRAVQPYSKHISDNFLFIGRRMNDEQGNKEFEWLKSVTKPLIYVSFGTVFPCQPAQINYCLSALKTLDCCAIISLNDENLIAGFGKLPEHIHLYRFVPQIEILKHANLFITHGGFNSLNEALYFGVPMLVCPQAIDQFYNADWIEKLGCGINFRNQTLNESGFKKAILKLLGKKNYSANCRRVGDTLKNEDKYNTIWDVIKQYCANH